MKLINHVLDIRRLIQQAFDNRFSRMGLRADAPVDASALQEEQKEKRVKLEEIIQRHGGIWSAEAEKYFLQNAPEIQEA